MDNNADRLLTQEELEEFRKQIRTGDFVFLDEKDIEPVSNNPIIQEFYDRFINDCITITDYKKLRKEIVRYMRKHGTKQDERDIQEFMESLVMLSEED